MVRLSIRLEVLIGLLSLVLFAPIRGIAAVECPPARYLVPDGSPAAVIEVLDDGTVAVEGVCPPIPAKLKGKRRVQKVRATWPKDACQGLTGKVKLRAKIDETCGTLRGKLRAKKLRQKFLASVSRCDDGLLDPPVDGACPLLEGPGDALAVDAVLDMDREDGVPDAELEGDEADGMVARTRLEVEIMPDATVGQVNAAIAEVSGEVLLSIRGMPFLLVRIPDPGTRAALDDVVATMAGMPGIATVLPGAVPGPDALPANYAPITGADLGRIDHHLAVRAPAAWNAQAAAVANVNVVVADLFGGGPPNGDLTATITSADFATGALRDHGYHVSGIVTGRFGGTACTGAIGTTGAAGRGCVTGMYPGTPRLPVVDLRLGLTDLAVQKRILDRVSLATGPVVVNTSLNDCGDGACGNAAIAAILARRWVTLVRDMGLEERFLHVTTSGNIKLQAPSVIDAQTNSAYSAAALLPGLTTVFGFELPNLTNLLVVDNVANGPGPDFAPVCMDETSKRGGTISGIGAGTGAGSGDDVWSFADATQASRFAGGTSMAAPQVSGLAAYLWSVDPGMTVAEMQSALLQTARPVVPSTTAGDCAAAGVVPAPIIDAYDAILSLDAAEPPDPIVATVRHAIMDHDGDGRFDDADVRAFLTAYFDGFVSAEQPGAPVEPIDRTFGREDLNGDGFVGGARTDAFDLDRVDSVQYGVSGYGLVQQGVENGVATFDEAAVTDLDVLCFYAYSDLYEGASAARTTLLGSAICNPIRLLIGFPSTVEVAVPEVLSVEVLREDPQLGSVPLAGALVEIDVLGGNALAGDGVTDGQGRFETEVAADGSASPMRIVARVRDVPEGPVLVEGFVDATIATTTTTTSTTLPPGSSFVCHDAEVAEREVPWQGFGEDCDPFPGCGCEERCSPSPDIELEVTQDETELVAAFRRRSGASPIAFSGGAVENVLTMDQVDGDLHLVATLRSDGVLAGRIDRDFLCNGFVCKNGWDFELGCGASPTTTSSTTLATTTTTTSSTTTTSTTETTTPTTSTTTTTTATLPPGAGFDYRLYPATGPDAPSVTLVDEFRNETVDLDAVDFHLAPSGIGGAFPVDPRSDLTCYQHPGAVFSGSASVVNRFSANTQALTLTGPIATCVPRDDALVQVDHFTCYGASGSSVDTPLTIFDRFQSESVTVGAPTLYCTPTDKNGEGVLVPPTPQVVCYGATPQGAAPGGFEVTNQFHTAPLDLAAPAALCVSSFVESVSGS